MARIHGFLLNFTARIQMDSRTWSRISDPEKKNGKIRKEKQEIIKKKKKKRKERVLLHAPKINSFYHIKIIIIILDIKFIVILNIICRNNIENNSKKPL